MFRAEFVGVVKNIDQSLPPDSQPILLSRPECIPSRLGIRRLEFAQKYYFSHSIGRELMFKMRENHEI